MRGVDEPNRTSDGDRRTEFKRKVTLVAGWHRLEAAKRLSWDRIPCVVLTRELETRFWQVAENYYRAELTALERAEGTEELRTLIKKIAARGGATCPPGGSRPNDLGIKRLPGRLV